jgi:hypothetical protein
MPDADLLIWWTDEIDYRQMGTDLPASVPEMIRGEYRSRYGRCGRGRLWVPPGIDLKRIPWDETSKAARHLESRSYGGIVFHAADLSAVIDLPGIVTNLDLAVIL